MRESIGALDSVSLATDESMMKRCVELSRMAVDEGEYPFGTVIAIDGKIVAEAVNHTAREKDITRHAEVIALSQVQKAIGAHKLHEATLYTNVEPCAMCSYCIREAGIGRVVYSLSSPVMGGVTKWNILRDRDLSDRVPIFGPVPEVVSGVLLAEVEQAWRDWNPFIWEMVKFRGVLTAPENLQDCLNVLPAEARTPWHHLRSVFTWLAYFGLRRPERG